MADNEYRINNGGAERRAARLTRVTSLRQKKGVREPTAVKTRRMRAAR